MLLHLVFLPKKDHPEKEQVNSELNLRVLLDGGPSCFHFRRPMDVIENEDAALVGMFQTGFKIFQGG